MVQQTSENEEPGVYRDDVEPGSGSIRNKQERRKCIRRVYGDSLRAPKGARWVPWVDIERIEAEIETLLPRDPQQAERFFLNRKQASEDAAFDAEKWNALTNTGSVPDKSRVVIGVDGARYDDALAVVATEIATGHQFVLGIWEKPEFEGDDYEHPRHEVDGAVSQAFETYDVPLAYCDPQFIDALIDRWQGRWGERVVKK